MPAGEEERFTGPVSLPQSKAVKGAVGAETQEIDNCTRQRSTYLDYNVNGLLELRRHGSPEGGIHPSWQVVSKVVLEIRSILSWKTHGNRPEEGAERHSVKAENTEKMMDFLRSQSGERSADTEVSSSQE